MGCVVVAVGRVKCYRCRRFVGEGEGAVVVFRWVDGAGVRRFRLCDRCADGVRLFVEGLREVVDGERCGDALEPAVELKRVLGIK